MNLAKLIPNNLTLLAIQLLPESTVRNIDQDAYPAGRELRVVTYDDNIQFNVSHNCSLESKGMDLNWLLYPLYSKDMTICERQESM